MKRREFLFLAITSILAVSFSRALSSVKIYVTEGKLGYKKNSDKGRQCSKCKHFEKRETNGICNLSTIKNIMKVKEVYVCSEATYNMWVQK